MSAALCNNKPMPIIPLQSSRSADYNSSVNKNKSMDDNKDNNNDNNESSTTSERYDHSDDTNDDDDDEIRVLEPGDLLKEIDSNIIPSANPIQHYSRSHEPHNHKTGQIPQLLSANSDRSGIKMSINDKRKPKQHRIIVTPPNKSTVTKFSNMKPPKYDDQ
eukprot:CAMPEP_0201572648 /NCGR_PEP_ID=MMETSP0190_2-20130828/16038_1 /ASSEMBLY_ACC=CAM_ASM_000263 /TAXON_ID=37353 /ORGANISM="Rosalina sp." /LENGTH=160 /DNA_ID=CAMNT_0047998683 /DNA_START=1368 /DNA_END=1850 /DNA_ORIENTATION=+